VQKKGQFHRARKAKTVSEKLFLGLIQALLVASLRSGELFPLSPSNKPLEFNTPVKQPKQAIRCHPVLPDAAPQN